MDRRAAAFGLLLAVVSFTACKDEDAAEADAPDARVAVEAAPPVFEDPRTGARFTWPAMWHRVSAPSPEPGDTVVTLAKLMRPKTDTPVVPRIALTFEPTTLDNLDLVSNRTKNVLEASLESAGAKVRRVTLSRRPSGGRFVGVLDLTYGVPHERGDPTNVRHRSIVAPWAGPEGSLAILTLTATYMVRDHDLVGPEVDAVFESFSAPASAPSVPLDRDE